MVEETEVLDPTYPQNQQESLKKMMHQTHQNKIFRSQDKAVFKKCFFKNLPIILKNI
jgi:hypothetical protein